MPKTDAETSLDAVVREYGRPDCHIGGGEDESPYVPFIENVFIRHVSFDVRSNSYANILWVRRYLEYDWVARPGSYVHESPGVIHTLVSDDPNGMKTFFWLNGSLEFYDDNDKLLQTLDVFWFIDHYLSYCRERGLKINQKMFV